MQRVRLAVEDFARTRVRASLGVWIETVFSLHALRYRGSDPVFAGWQRHVTNRVGPETRMLTELWPQLFVVEQWATRPPVDGQCEPLDALAFAPGWPRSADDALGEMVVDGVRDYGQIAVQPFWRTVQTVLDASRRRLVRILGERGVDALLQSLHPSITWRPPVLEVGDPAGPSDRETLLSGRGLEIVPSLFCPPGYPMVLAEGDDERAGTLFVPAWYGFQLADIASTNGAQRRPLGLLVGQTRASMLLVVSDGACSTSEMARRSGISVSAASQHARVLREAGLIHSERHRSAVLHTLTPLGERLVGGSPDRSEAY